MASIYLFLAFIGLLIIGVPIAYSLIIPAVGYFILHPGLLGMVPIRIYEGLDSYSLLALPLFIAMGKLMNAGGITDRLIDFAMLILGRIKGGLALVNVLASMLFGGISGSSVADTGSIGSVLIPAMEKTGYRKRTATGLTVASSTMGMIIPPSVPMIVYAVAANASVGKLFLAGAIPGLMIGVLQLIISFWMARRRDWPKQKVTWKRTEIIKMTLELLPAILMPAFIVGVIVLGVTTPTEAASAGLLYAIVFGTLFYRELTWQKFRKVLEETIYVSASIMMIVAFTQVFSWILINEHVPNMLAELFLSLPFPNYAVLLLFAALLFFVGDFIDVSPAILLLTPLFLPTMQYLGISHIQFGVVLIVGLAFGLGTPPVGQCLNVANKISGMEVIDTFIGAIPWLTANVVVLLLTCVVPAISLWLPGLLF